MYNDSDASSSSGSSSGVMSSSEDGVALASASGGSITGGALKKPISAQNSLDRATKQELMTKKQVSFSADPEENVIITGARDCICLMTSGSEFIKVKPGAREFQRHYRFNQESMSIHWAPSRKKSSKIMVSEIASVQMGQKTESFRSALVDYPSSRCFSILLRDNTSIDLVAMVPNEAYIWVKGLRCLVTGGLDGEEHKAAEELRDQWLEEIYYAADLNHDGTLEHIEFLELMESLNKHLTTLHVVKRFRESEMCKAGSTLPLEQFKAFFKQVVNRPEVHVVLARYATNNDYLTPTDLQLFLQAEQDEWDTSISDCIDLIQRYEPTSEGKNKNYMTVDGFSSFLMSDDNACYRDDPLDMSYPLNDYYVKSTYSSGCFGWPDQPEITTDNFVSVLQENFRCLRLEVWDGPNEPNVCHRSEMTNRISLQSVLETINSTAFNDTELPLFLNIESHCSPTQNLLVAKLLKSIFQDRLFSSTNSSVPTLQDVRQKVLIKASSNCEDRPNGTSMDRVGELDGSGGEDIMNASLLRKRKRRNGPVSDDGISSIPAFFSLFFDDKDPTCCNYVADVTDAELDNVIGYSSCSVIEHNRSNYTLVRPREENVESPLGHWQSGCQLVQMYSTQLDFPTMLNRAMFLQEGGMTLKPPLLRQECYHYSIDTDTHIAGIHPKHLSIRLISAQQLPKPEGSVSKADTIDPYIVVRIIGIPADYQDYKTYIVKNDGFHPVWEVEVSFTVLNVDCAMVHILMLDHDFIGDDYIGQILVPLKMLKPGFRHIPLCSRDGATLDPASVFVHIDMKDQLDLNIQRCVGNPKKKGLSPKCESLKQTGVANIDNKLKGHQVAMESLYNLLVKYRATTMEFKAAAGLDYFAHVRHCIRLLDLRLQAIDCALTISEDGERGVPKIAVAGVIQVGAVQKALATFDSMMDAALLFKTEGPKMLADVNTLISHFDIYRKDLMEFVEGCQANKRRTKALQNFSYNLWLLREYRQLYTETELSITRTLKQVSSYTSNKIKKGSWMLRRPSGYPLSSGGGSSTGSGGSGTGVAPATPARLVSITENSSGSGSFQEDAADEEVFDSAQSDGILRPSTKIPTKSSLKQPTTDFSVFLDAGEI